MKKKNVKLVACLSLTGFLALCGLPYMNNNNYNIGIMETQAAEITNTWESGNTTVTLDSEGTLTVTAKAGTDGAMANYTKNTDIPWNKNVANVKNIIINDGVTNIGDRALSSFENLAQIDLIIPNSVTRLGEYCLAWGKGIKNIKIGTGLRTIAYNPYQNVFDIESIEYLGDIGLINTSEKPNPTVKSVKLTDNYTGVPYKFFSEIFFTERTEIILPDTVTYIGDNSLNANNLFVMNIPKNIKYIGRKAIENFNESKIVLPNSIEVVNNDAFKNIECTNLTELPNLKYVGRDSFSNATDIGYSGLDYSDSHSFIYYPDQDKFILKGIPKLEPQQTLTIPKMYDKNGEELKTYRIEMLDITDFSRKWFTYATSQNNNTAELVLNSSITEINVNPIKNSNGTFFKVIFCNVDNLKKLCSPESSYPKIGIEATNGILPKDLVMNDSNSVSSSVDISLGKNDKVDLSNLGTWTSNKEKIYLSSNKDRNTEVEVTLNLDKFTKFYTYDKMLYKIKLDKDYSINSQNPKYLEFSQEYGNLSFDLSNFTTKKIIVPDVKNLEIKGNLPSLDLTNIESLNINGEINSISSNKIKNVSINGTISSWEVPEIENLIDSDIIFQTNSNTVVNATNIANSNFKFEDINFKTTIKSKTISGNCTFDKVKDFNISDTIESGTNLNFKDINYDKFEIRNSFKNVDFNNVNTNIDFSKIKTLSTDSFNGTTFKDTTFITEATAIGNSVFANSNIEEVHLKGISSIGSDMFKNVSSNHVKVTSDSDTINVASGGLVINNQTLVDIGDLKIVGGSSIYNGYSEEMIDFSNLTEGTVKTVANGTTSKKFKYTGDWELLVTIPNNFKEIYLFGEINSNMTKSDIPSASMVYCLEGSSVETWCINNNVTYKTLTDEDASEIINGKRPIINQFNLSFDKQNPSDLHFDFDLGSDKLGAKSIKNIIINGKKLIKDTDFVISDSTVTLNKSIFETLINDTYQVTVIFDNGYTIDDKVKIIVYGDDVILTPENTVPQQYATYNNENPKDISFKVYCESIDSIIINNKELDINDYILAEYRTANINNPKLLTIKKEVLNTLKTGEYEIIVVTDGIMIRNKLSIFVTNKNNEDNTQPPIILDTVKYEFYKDYPDFIVIPFSFNRANSITEVKIGSNILDSTHYDIVDSTIIIDKDYLSTLDIGKYVVSVTFDDNTKRSNAQLIVYEKAADRAAPYLLQSHIIFNGNSINLSFDPGEGDLETTNVLALVLDNELILPNGDKIPFNSSNINKLQKAYEDYTNKENEEEVASPSNAKKEETNINNNENNDREDTNINIKEDESIDNENNDSQNTNINEYESNINDTKETNTNKNNIDNEDTNTNKDETINNKDDETNINNSEDNKEDNNLIKVEIEQVASNSFNLFATLDDYDTVFVTNGTEITLDGAYIESLNLSEGDHLIGAIFDNTERTTDVKKVILTIPKTDGEDKPTPPDDSDKEEPVNPTPKPDEGNKPTPPDNNNGGGSSGGGSSSGGSSGSNSKPDNNKPSPINPDGSLNPDYKPVVPDTGGKFEGEGNDWTYIKPDGSQAKNEWVGDGEDWYYIDENSKLKYDWALINNEWYMLNREHDGKFGAAKYGWYKENQDSQWYFMNPRDTKMLTGWQKINHKWYYFNINQGEPTYYGDNQSGWKYDKTKGIRPHGSMYANEITPDGYKTNEKGEWIE